MLSQSRITYQCWRRFAVDKIAATALAIWGYSTKEGAYVVDFNSSSSSSKLDSVA